MPKIPWIRYAVGLIPVGFEHTQHLYCWLPGETEDFQLLCWTGWTKRNWIGELVVLNALPVAGAKGKTKRPGRLMTSKRSLGCASCKRNSIQYKQATAKNRSLFRYVLIDEVTEEGAVR